MSCYTWCRFSILAFDSGLFGFEQKCYAKLLLLEACSKSQPFAYQEMIAPKKDLLTLPFGLVNTNVDDHSVT